MKSDDDYREAMRDAMAVVTAMAEDPSGDLARSVIEDATDRVDPTEIVHALGVIAGVAMGLAARWQHVPEGRVREVVFAELNLLMEDER